MLYDETNNLVHGEQMTLVSNQQFSEGHQATKMPASGPVYGSMSECVFSITFHAPYDYDKTANSIRGSLNFNNSCNSTEDELKTFYAVHKISLCDKMRQQMM